MPQLESMMLTGMHVTSHVSEHPGLARITLLLVHTVMLYAEQLLVIELHNDWSNT